MTTANVYQQRPDSGAKAESSLHHANLAGLIGKGRKNPGVTVREKKLLGHLTLRGDAKDPAFAEGVHKALGLELPVALSLVANAETSLQWMGPDEWLLIVPGGQEFAVEQALRAALAGLHISVVNVSGGQQLLELSGPKVREVLMKSTSYDDLSHMTRGELRLGLPLLGSNTLFAGLFAEYRRRYPNIQVHLVEEGSLNIEQAVLSGELELGGSLTPKNPAFAYQPFCDEPLDVLLPTDHPLAEGPGVRLEQLADTPFLLYQRSFVLNDRVLKACQQAGFTPKEGGRSGQADFLVALVAAGQGVVLLPSVVARGLVRPGIVRLKLIAPHDLRWDIAFIWRDGAYLSRAAQAWLELLRERPVTGSVL